jgi:hypothetical protein
MRESDWQEQIVGRTRDHEGIAIRTGWQTLHVRAGASSRGRWSVPVSGSLAKGWPDLILVRPGRRIAAELKVRPRVPTPEQLHVLAILDAAGFETFVWYPEDFEEVVRVLTDGRVSVS